MNSLRVAFAGVQPLIRTILEAAVANATDMVLVGTLDQEDTEAGALRFEADVVISSGGVQWLDRVRSLLGSEAALVVIGAGGRTATYYASVQVQKTIDDVSPGTLLDFIREAASKR